jgi:hypothetical protein
MLGRAAKIPQINAPAHDRFTWLDIFDGLRCSQPLAQVIERN